MKKYLATYLAVFSFLCAGFVSCSKSDDGGSDVELAPYALVRSFSLGNIRSAYPAFTSDGRDTVSVKTVDMSSFLFTIDQATGEIYNNDSLLFSTNVTKVVTNITADGLLSLYVDSIADYVAYSNGDSVDFSTPRKMRVHSFDGQFYKDYTITINVHQVNPDKMVWSEWDAVEGVEPVRAIELDGQMCLFGSKNGNPVVAKSEIGGEPLWVVADVAGLPAAADFSTVQMYGSSLYAIANGNLYASVDAVNWSLVLEGKALVSITVASDDAGKFVVAGENGFFCSNDAVSFVEAGTVPEGFPMYGVSALSYPLSHNRNIIRYIAIGYDTPAMDGKARVWSRLSNETEWVDYENDGSSYACPSLKGLSVVRFDNFLYALGGPGKADGVDVPAFSSFFISRDNGITWKRPSDFYQCMDEGLVGNESPFAVAVDSNNFIWIFNSGAEGAVRKCIINRLGFKK